MLTPSYLFHATEPAEEIAEQLHSDIIRRIVERIQIRFQRGDDYILTPVDKWQLETLQQAGFLLDDITKEIAKATELGIVNGVGNGEFDPERPVTRAECAAIAVRLYELLSK